MIGQNSLSTFIDELIADGDFPRFTLIIGPRGSGKKTLSYSIHDKLGGLFVNVGTSIDAVRRCIVQSYQTREQAVYLFADADKMSISAKNALLKIVEEPPKNAYFIMTAQNEYAVLNTIRSRAVVLEMMPYSSDELELYMADKNVTDDEMRILKEVCQTPGDIDLMQSYGIVDIYNYVNKVVDNIGVVSGANAFKIADRLKLKESDDGYDIQLFLKIFKTVIAKRAVKDRENHFRLANIGRITGNYMNDLIISGINKQMLIDCWILDVRRELMND